MAVPQPLTVREAMQTARAERSLIIGTAAQSLMLVVSRHADERLWAEVLNLGGFDVLALPFDRDELKWALSSALRHSPRASVAAAAV